MLSLKVYKSHANTLTRVYAKYIQLKFFGKYLLRITSKEINGMMFCIIFNNS